LITCPGSGTSFHRHPTSCSKFIHCSNGQASIIDCHEGFYFDPGLGHCFFADQVDCVLDSSDASTTIDITITTEPPTSETTNESEENDISENPSESILHGIINISDFEEVFKKA
ncbi:hypothetical protein Trydic_g21838, partial [Trypoxylus dichotomus]